MMHSYEDGVLVLENDDGGTVTYAYNSETQTPFESEEEALSFAFSRPLYFVKPLSLDNLKSNKLMELKFKYIDEARKPILTSKLGFDIDASLWDRDNLIIAKKLGAKKVRGADNKFYTVTEADLEVLIGEIEVNGMVKYQAKWDKEAEIEACKTIEEIHNIQI